MAKQYFQNSPLDVNLWVDRGANTVEDLELILEFPDEVHFGEEAEIRIVNYDPFYIYEAVSKYGSVRIDKDLIFYQAPSTPDHPQDDLIITVTINPRSLAYFPPSMGNGDYIYDGDGIIHFVDDILFDDTQSESLKEYLRTLREEYEMMVEEAKSSVKTPTIPFYDYSKDTTQTGDEYRVDQTFTGYSNLQRNWWEDGVPSGGVNGYHLPSDIDLQPNHLGNIYRVVQTEDGSNRVTFKSRNSNTNEAQGNTNEGYRFPGAIGSSLSVVNSGDKTKKTFDFGIPIDLYPLEAVVPPEILSLCISSVEVVPILRGIEDGHTFLWEQIAGDESEVVWVSDRTDKEFIINIGKIKSDRVFRFWISKGTKYEKSYDVVIYGTPKDEIVGNPNAGNHFGVQGTNLNLHHHETRPILLTAERLWVKEFRVQFIDKIR